MITTPAEYRPLLAVEADPAAMARTGYVFCALRRELDWHIAVSTTAILTHERRAATVAALEVRDAVAQLLEFTPWDLALEALAGILERTTMDFERSDGTGFSYAVDADQLEYRADAAARVRLILRGAEVIL